MESATKCKYAQHYIRPLTTSDEIAVQKLLKSVYGETYSYKKLYEEGYYSNLVDSRKILSYGEFLTTGELIGHSAFWLKDPKNNYVESGLSFRAPSARTDHVNSEITRSFWNNIYHELSSHYAFIHQHTTTLHPFAQRYAIRHMLAVTCGIIIGYAYKEKISGISHPQDEMHALIMTTPLPIALTIPQTCYLPDPWADWLMIMYDMLKLPRKLVPVAISSKKNNSLTLQDIEHNEALSLRRRVVKFNNANTQINISKINSSFNTEIIHLACDNSQVVNEATEILLRNNYFPVGLRPHCDRPDEILFQKLFGKTEKVRNLFDTIKLAESSIKKVIVQWRDITLLMLSTD